MPKERGRHGDMATWPVFLLNGLGLSLGAKLVSTNDRPSYPSVILRLFPTGGEEKNCAAFCANRLEVLKACMSYMFSRKKSKI